MEPCPELPYAVLPQAAVTSPRRSARAATFDPESDLKPLTPHLNGKVQRSHRIDDEEFYRLLEDEGVVVDDTAILNAKFQELEHFYNFDPPRQL